MATQRSKDELDKGPPAAPARAVPAWPGRRGPVNLGGPVAPETVSPDYGTPDSGTPDSGTPDSGTPDSGTPHATADRQETRGSALVIGEGIEVKGEISSCETLVVEGRLEASTEVSVLKLAESGIFKGTASVGTAEVSGRFEGSLTVHGDLHLRPTARVGGRIRYGRIIIEGGGEISGDIAVLRAGDEPRVEAAAS